MSQQLVLSISLDDGRTLTATALPDESGQLPALSAGTATLRPTDSELDTAGHAGSADVAVDVEGHAMTLRLPNVSDAAALRRALAISAVTATILAAGAVAAMQQPAAPPNAPGVEQPAPQPEPNVPPWAARPD